MFITTYRLKKILTEILFNSDSLIKLKEELENLKLKKRLEEEEIKHLVKMKEEKQAVELQKKELDMQKLFQQKEMDLQSKYHEKIIQTIHESRTEARELYTKIMERLPNVNVRMKR